MKKLVACITFFAVLVFYMSSCEKDDLCAEGTPTTPSLVIEFYKSSNRTELNPVENLKYFAEGRVDTLSPGTVSRIRVPLKTDLNNTKWGFIRSRTTINGVTRNLDYLDFKYAVSEEYVSRACGYRAIFLLDPGTDQDPNPLLTDGDASLWMQDIEVMTTEIKDEFQTAEDEENDVHIKIISFFVLVSFSALAQNQPKDTTAVAPPGPAPQRYGLRVGVDAYKFARSSYDNNFRGIELVGDYRLSKKFYAAAELGNTKITVDEPQLNFTTNGSYLKFGFDYNVYENWLDMENMIYTGVRYGFSTFKQTLNSYTIYQNSNILTTDDGAGVYNYFNDVTVYPGTEYTSLTAHWIEIVGGFKAEVLNNLFIGISARLNLKLAETIPNGFANLYIPGFNRTYEGSFGVGFNYTVSYFIPFYKKQPKPDVKPSKDNKEKK